MKNSVVLLKAIFGIIHLTVLESGATLIHIPHRLFSGFLKEVNV